MHIHFIAIGGAAMHNLAIALHSKGYKVTGSDDEIFDPSKSRLQKHGLLPEEFGWFPDKINDQIDVIILGMHARKDNPELIRAQELNLKVYSYPEYLYEQCKDKKRVVIGGSHGKTTITSMVMHVLKTLDYKFDYMVGAQIEGFDTMVSVSHDAPIAIFEGDEYLSSPIDLRPKFHWYKPHIALLTGVAWDHINVFPTWDNYVEQFKIFSDSIEKNGTLVWYLLDEELQKIAPSLRKDIKSLAYDEIESNIEEGQTTITFNGKKYYLSIFGGHNLQNLNGARLVCAELGIDDEAFLTAISTFKGAAKRLQTLKQTVQSTIYLDFAHSPSKLKATIEAVKNQNKERTLVACMELHTFSSLNKDFLPQYKETMNKADIAFVYFNPQVVEHKKLPKITIDEVTTAFGSKNVKVFDDTELLQKELKNIEWKNKNLLLMSSGNFSGIDFNIFSNELI
ncbi:UDP-N-acetylmuramate--L-alanine ligase [Plebeiibacterium sediminum]|uniref:Mur ligase family protein n=1 Tax=Plebeiibacterium sediminum TaxID=2992112 RepID=A0AAE3SDM3_9BACT|nr:Mur ligase family protein [Plebeiobacterium sediminum]MCW3784997.1 Mur ligase family protein [Plebeiobacterium sediminum]